MTTPPSGGTERWLELLLLLLLHVVHLLALVPLLVS